MSIFGYRNRRRRTYGWGFGAPPRRRSRYYSTWGGPRGGYHPMRRQSRGNVRVVGCCLPIPIGVMALGVGAKAIIGRTR
jgi:hypothetical protein